MHFPASKPISRKFLSSALFRLKQPGKLHQIQFLVILVLSSRLLTDLSFIRSRRSSLQSCVIFVIFTCVFGISGWRGTKQALAIVSASGI
mmetsp:Transcript_15720/g.52628  ORF Transcript_15720/g.52628 Transcript_15720/m.52628 type:complete len:90 (-) Transcript_15720:128-397(-)